MATVVPAFIEKTTAASSHTFSAPSGIAGMSGLIVACTGTSSGTGFSASASGATFTELDDGQATNVRYAVYRVTGLSSGATVTISLSGSSNTLGIAQFYTDEHTFPSSINAGAIRSSSSTSTTTNSISPSSVGQRVLVVGVERTTDATTVSSVTSSDGETVTTLRYGEGSGSSMTSSIYIGRFDAANTTSHTATITYSNSSQNGYGVLIPLTAVSGGGGDPGGGSGGGSGGGGTAAPTLVTAPYLVSSGTNGTSSLVSPSFTPSNGEVVVVKASTNDSATVIGTPSGGSQTYTLRGSVTSGSFCYTTLHTAVISGSPGAMTITIPFSGDTGKRSMVVERWTSASLAGTPSTNSTKTGSGAPSTVLTTTGTNSVVSWVNADWNANSPASRTYRSSATEVGIHDQNAAADNQYVGYYAWQSTASPGAQTLGLTAPTGQAWSLIGVEIQGQTAPATLTPVIRSSSSLGLPSTASSANCPAPSGIQVGDYLLAVLTSDADGTLASMSASAFSTVLTSVTGSSSNNVPFIEVFGKVATSADASASSFAFSNTADSDTTLTVIAVQTGTYSTSTPVTVGAFTTQARTSTTLQTAPSMTGAVDQLLLAIFGADINNVPASTPFQEYPSSGPTGMTRVQSVRGGGNWALSGVYAQALTSAGPTGTRTVTPDNAGSQNGWAAGLIAVNPASVTGGGGGGGGGSNTTGFFLGQ